MTDAGHPAILLGSGVSAVSALQSLRRRAVVCWVADSIHQFAGHAAGARFFRIPDLQFDEAGAIDGIVALARRCPRPPVILPTLDGYAQLIARHAAALEPVALFARTEPATIDRLVDKRRFGNWADNHVTGFPRSWNVGDADPAAFAAGPVIVKRAYHEWAGAAARGWPTRDILRPFVCRIAEDETAYRSLCAEAGPYRKFLVAQDLVPGPVENGYSIGLYADRDGRITTLFVGRKLRGSPLFNGTASAAQNDVVAEPVIDQVTGIVRDLGFAGVAEFEYKRDAETGALRLLEINPRCWTWMGITAGTDADVAWRAYQDLTGHALPAVAVNRTPGMRSYAEVLRDGYTALVLYPREAPDRAPGLRNWLRFVLSKRTVTLELRNGDWRMLFWQPAEGVLFWFRAMRAKGVRKARNRSSTRRPIGS